MHPYDLKGPCANCPFRKQGGVRLTRARVQEIIGTDGEFHCHKTVNHDDDGESFAADKSKVCAGFLIFREKQEAPNQMMRIAERLGMYDAAALMSRQDVVDSVVDSPDEIVDPRWEGNGSC